MTGMVPQREDEKTPFRKPIPVAFGLIKKTSYAVLLLKLNA